MDKKKKLNALERATFNMIRGKNSESGFFSYLIFFSFDYCIWHYGLYIETCFCGVLHHLSHYSKPAHCHMCKQEQVTIRRIINTQNRKLVTDSQVPEYLFYLQLVT